MKGSSYLGLDLSIDSSMGTLFEFPSVQADVGSYRSRSEKIPFKMHWLSPNDYPENKDYNKTESTQLEEPYPLEHLLLAAPPITKEENFDMKQEITKVIEKGIDESIKLELETTYRKPLLL
ncbi:hypothetical protein PNOK_0017200 [Pyrrhoderma noxium]|uniref:Uncharacterized protein n=1 Tax=Pyrrhoderma noxium TaxID=2282107 RepID=A0A286UUH1_9AGAM|nr:hypothetical protein PNOK_0017200 [Pyrrhoderma noxium]